MEWNPALGWIPLPVTRFGFFFLRGTEGQFLVFVTAVKHSSTIEMNHPPMLSTDHLFSIHPSGWLRETFLEEYISWPAQLQSVNL